MLRMLDSLTHDRVPYGRTGPATLPALWSAFREALEGSRQYQSLRSRGLSHDAAIRHALGIAANRTLRLKPLYFSGRA